VKKLFKIFFLFIFLFAGKSAFAQVGLKAMLDTNKIRIGEQVKLDLYVLYNPNSGVKSIEWPSFSDTITEKIEVLSVSAIDSTMPDKNDPSMMQQHQQILISVYDSGYYAVPPFKFIINGDTANPQWTEPLLIEVHTVPTDSSLKKTKDIKEPLNEPFSWLWYKEYFYWGIAIVVFIAGVILYVYYRNKRARQKVFEPEKPKIPAHITALASLERIREQQIWKEGHVKEYYSEITDTIRLYIEERYDVLALESTTDELLQIMRTQVIDTVSKEKLQHMLKLADFVKFAKMIPLEQQHAQVLQDAFDFVNGTKREDVIEIIDESGPKASNLNTNEPKP
jgi:hypothetical protein